MPDVPRGADAGARDKVPEFLQTPVFHSYRPGEVKSTIRGTILENNTTNQ
jgi:hypothetical protein